jgi:hypothetical protein
MNPPGVYKPKGIECISYWKLIVWKLCPYPFVVWFDAGIFFG